MALRRDRIANDRYAFALTLPRVALLPGKYLVRAHALDPEGVRLFDNVERTFVVTGATREMGLVRLAHRWNDPGARRKAMATTLIRAVLAACCT